MDIATARFSGHQSFALRNTWLTKGVRACAEDPAAFRAPDAMVRLGVGKNMVEAIKYWGLAAQMLTEAQQERYTLRPTSLGWMLFGVEDGRDPYLEDDGTLWLLHWLLATNPSSATTIYYAFNEWSEMEFTRVGLEYAIAKLVERAQARATSETIARDVGVFIRTYVGSTGGRGFSVEDSLDSPLSDLALLNEVSGQQTYSFARGPKDTLPDAIVLFALDGYWRAKGKSATLTFDELAYAARSPGRVFKLDEAALSDRLERVGELTGGAWQLTETAGFRQITVRHELDGLGLLRGYYERASAGATYG